MNFEELERLKEQNTKIFKGIPGAPGYAIGPIVIYEREILEIYPSVSLDQKGELENFEFALDKSKKELDKIINFSREKLKENATAILEAHLLILEDDLIIEEIKKNIKIFRFSAEYAVEKVFSKYINMLKQSDDHARLERANDIEDVKLRILRNLKKKRWKSKLQKSSIIFAHNLTPADTVIFTRNNVLAYVSEIGGLTSHAAILARALNIPAVLGIHKILNEVKDYNGIAIVDGFSGTVIINPGQRLIEYYQKKLESYVVRQEKLKDIKNLESKTKEGTKIILQSNIDFISEIPYAIAAGTEGVGLYRSENLFFERQRFPSEAEQLEAYISLAEKMYPNLVTIRVFDIGGDKLITEDFVEKNPFLGWRGIRLLLHKQDILETQYRAILKASIYKNIQIMLPMVSSIDEIIDAKNLLENIKEELRREKINFDEKIKFGIMVEVPSIVFCLKDAANHIDFISVGTNDLTQFLLAVDRGNENVAEFYQEFHPSLIRILKKIIDDAEEAKLDTSICGEIASDILAVPLLIGLGYRKLSINEYLLPEIKSTILKLQINECQNLAKNCLKQKTNNDIQKLLIEFKEKLNGEKNESLY